MAAFGEVLREIRKERGLTLEELAQHLETSKQVLSRYERGLRVPKVDTVNEYAKKLGLEPECMQKTIAEIRSVLPPEFKDAPPEKVREEYSYRIMMGDLISSPVHEVTPEDYAALEALHQNPQLRLLFDRAKNVEPEDVDFMLKYAERILKERDGN